MTGSPLIPVVVPIVVLLALGLWIAIVFYAAVHPEWKRAGGRAGAGTTVPQPHVIQSVNASAGTGPGDHGSGEHAAPQPGQRAA